MSRGTQQKTEPDPWKRSERQRTDDAVADSRGLLLSRTRQSPCRPPVDRQPAVRQGEAAQASARRQVLQHTAEPKALFFGRLVAEASVFGRLAQGKGSMRVCLSVSLSFSLSLLTCSGPPCGGSDARLKRWDALCSSSSAHSALSRPSAQVPSESSCNTAVQNTCPRPGWVSMLLLDQLRNAGQPLGSVTHDLHAVLDRPDLE